jgi:LysR family transcriptional regulator of abg operon
VPADNQKVSPMQLGQIRAFLAVRDAGSLRAAARQIGLSQPAISKALASLEEDLQAQLFIRTSRGVRVTEAGRLFGARAASVQAELARVREELAELRGGAEGSAAVGIGPAGITLAPRAIARFRKERPLARIRIREGTRDVHLPLVRDGSLDFTLSERGFDPVEGGLTFKPLWHGSLSIVARRGNPLARATSLAQLAGAQWVLIYRPGAGGLAERSLLAAGLPPPAMAVHCESHATAISLIANSDLVGLVPTEDIESGGIAGMLQRVNVRERLHRTRIGAFVRADTPLSPAAASMLQAFVIAARSSRHTTRT